MSLSVLFLFAPWTVAAEQARKLFMVQSARLMPGTVMYQLEPIIRSQRGARMPALTPDTVVTAFPVPDGDPPGSGPFLAAGARESTLRWLVYVSRACFAFLEPLRTAVAELTKGNGG